MAAETAIGATGLQPRRRAGVSFTVAGGVLAVLGGVGHTVTAIAQRHSVWRGMFSDGLVGAVPVGDVQQVGALEAFWYGPGSFGPPLVLMGSWALWSSARGHRVPGWLGWAWTLWWSGLGVLGGFDIGTCILMAIGALIGVGDLLGDSRIRREEA